MLWNEYTATRNPQCRTINIGRHWTFYFGIPFLARATLAPAKGTDVAALHPFVDWGCVGISGIGAIVTNTYVAKMIDKTMCELAVEVTEPQAYS